MASITHDRADGPFPSPYIGCRMGVLDDVAHSASLLVSGELCAVTALEHARQLQELVDLGYLDLRIELQDLVLCTSDGLDLWDDVQHRLDADGGRLTLSGATGVVKRVLEVMTASAVHFCPTVVRAV